MSSVTCPSAPPHHTIPRAHTSVLALCVSAGMVPAARAYTKWDVDDLGTSDEEREASRGGRSSAKHCTVVVQRR
jgi:hypothetical protein